MPSEDWMGSVDHKVIFFPSILQSLFVSNARL